MIICSWLCAHKYAFYAISPLRPQVLSQQISNRHFVLFFNLKGCCCYPKHDTLSWLPNGCIYLASSVASMKPNLPWISSASQFCPKCQLLAFLKLIPIQLMYWIKSSQMQYKVRFPRLPVCKSMSGWKTMAGLTRGSTWLECHSSFTVRLRQSSSAKNCFLLKSRFVAFGILHCFWTSKCVGWSQKGPKLQNEPNLATGVKFREIRLLIGNLFSQSEGKKTNYWLLVILWFFRREIIVIQMTFFFRIKLNIGLFWFINKNMHSDSKYWLTELILLPLFLIWKGDRASHKLVSFRSLLCFKMKELDCFCSFCYWVSVHVTVTKLPEIEVSTLQARWCLHIAILS